VPRDHFLIRKAPVKIFSPPASQPRPSISCPIVVNLSPYFDNQRAMLYFKSYSPKSHTFKTIRDDNSASDAPADTFNAVNSTNALVRVRKTRFILLNNRKKIPEIIQMLEIRKLFILAAQHILQFNLAMIAKMIITYLLH
jgi:hypothetical protein